MIGLNRFLKILGLRKKSVLLFLFQIQDLDLLLPVAKSLRRKAIDVRAILHPHVLTNSPRVQRALDSEGIPWSPLGSKASILWHVFRSSALVNAADTTAKAHRAGYLVTKVAGYLGLQTFTFQHGLENIGLTYYDSEFPPEAVNFAAKNIFIWCEDSLLDSRVPNDIRRRCRPIGCPKEYRLNLIPNIELPFAWNKLIVIFENLHWARYSDVYREKFLVDLSATAEAFPEVTFLVKPHHAGRWLSKQPSGTIPKRANIIVADPKDPQWEPYTAPALIKVASGVITTPSTTAFDSVNMGKTPAIIGYDLDLPIYSPLPIMRSQADWMAAVADFIDRERQDSLHILGQRFKDSVSIPGEAAKNVSHHISDLM